MPMTAAASPSPRNPTDPALSAFCANETISPLLRELAAQGDVRRYRKGTIVIAEGDVGDTMFIVLSGQVKVSTRSETSHNGDGNDKEVTFGVFSAGEYFGEMALDGEARSADVITLQVTTCAVITRARLLAFIALRPEFALQLLAKVIRRLRATTLNTKNLAFIDVYGRLTQCLYALAKPQEDGTQRIEDRLTHAELASRVGCSREMVSRILKDLETGGYLRVVERRIVLLKKLPLRW